MGNSRYWRHSAKRKKQIGKYKSVLEAKFAADLEEKGIGFGYEPETLEYRTRVVRGVCDACGHTKVSQNRTYLPDFRVRVGDRIIFVETKGRLTGADRAKMVAVKAAHPELDIRLVFGSNNKLRKGSDKRYSDWADKHSFLWSVGARWTAEWGGVLYPASASVEYVGSSGTESQRAKRGNKARQRKGRSASTTTGPSDRDSEGT